MSVVTGSKLVITDSGGLQEETTYLDIPCLTLRDNTERPVTITLGTNRLVDTSTLGAALEESLNGNGKESSVPPFWDGKTAQRAVEALRRRLA